MLEVYGLSNSETLVSKLYYSFPVVNITWEAVHVWFPTRKLGFTIILIAREGSIKKLWLVWTHPNKLCGCTYTCLLQKYQNIFIHVKQVCQWTLGDHSWMSSCIWMAVLLGIESDECDGSAGQAGSLWQVSSVCWGRIEALLPPPSRADLWLPTSSDWQELLTAFQIHPTTSAKTAVR